jgi:hypothetical protein
MEAAIVYLGLELVHAQSDLRPTRMAHKVHFAADHDVVVIVWVWHEKPPNA